MSTDKISDILTIIRNGYLAKKDTISLPYSKLREEIAKVMVEEKYLKDLSVTEEDQFKKLQLDLLYVNEKPAVHNLKRISKPGLRIYKSASQLIPILSGLGISILSTSKGIMTDKQARKQNIGGEVLCELW